MAMDDLRLEMNARFEQVHERFDEADRRFGEIRQLIADDGLRIRRHFDAVAEQMKAEREKE